MTYNETAAVYTESLQLEIVEVQKQLSIVDLAQQDVLHFVEFGSYETTESHTIIANLKAIRDKRRGIKNRLDMLNDIKRRIQATENNNCSLGEKQYTYRVFKPNCIKGGALKWKA